MVVRVATTFPGPSRDHGPGTLDHRRESYETSGRCDRDPYPAVLLHRGYGWTLGYILTHAFLLSVILPPSLTMPAPANAQLQQTWQRLHVDPHPQWLCALVDAQ
ncbi:hypothetical protein SCLCIDRAFT_1220673 [Scleroderma citrinum Foug A]|uniref:Uncharacterized protein n=1 Tax=Scleroderma citrinum Foug A TaxID=1036808 RepID=A0A0C3DIX9_9AGAM|nr:hypothetical protein SCLCIDRAFT_1220673 [Scleroderma citrinum Foug A]